MEKQRLEFELIGNIRDFTKNMGAAKGSLKGIADAVKESLAQLPGGNKVSKEIKDTETAAKSLIKKLEQLQAAGKTSMSQLTPKQRSSITGAAIGYESKLAAAKPSSIESAETKALAEEQKKTAKETKALAAAQRAEAREAMNAANHSITLRYALYDVSSVARSASTALLGMATASVQAQMKQQQAFAQIEKTQVGTETTVAQMEKLKSELIDLSTQIPVSFTDLAKIGTLGAQLGIASNDIASFTETTAKFSAITGMSAEEAAMGFGKVANLLGLAGNQYAALGSAIAKVGVTSAATEQQIINTAGQIGAVAKAAGLSASEVIGLSSAMASLKIAPEEARGVLVQTFNAMSTAARSFSVGVGHGSEQLKFFAEISKMSQADFAAQWSDKTSGGAGKVWESFVRGLGKTDASAALNRLGLDGVRTSKGLTALGSNAEAVFKQIADAAKAGLSGAFLTEAASPVFETLASKFTKLQNSFENLSAAASGSNAFTAALGTIVDALTQFNAGLTKVLEKNDFVAFIAAATIGISAFVGILLTLGATLAAGVGGMLAIRTAFLNYIGTTGIATTATTNLIASFLRIPPSAVAAAQSLRTVAAAETTMAGATVVASNAMKILKWSMRGLLLASGIGAIIAVIGGIAEAAGMAGEKTPELGDGLDEIRNKANPTTEELSMLRQALIDMVNESSAAVLGLANTNQALFDLGQSLQGGKNDFSIYSQAGRKNLTALQSVMTNLATSANGNEQILANSLLGLKNAMVAAGIASVDAFALIDAAILNTGKTAQATSQDLLTSLVAGLNTTANSAGVTKTALEKLQDTLDKLFRAPEARLGIQNTLDGLGKALSESNKKVGYGSEATRNSLKAIKDTIEALATSSNGDLKVFSGNLASLRVAMSKMGITSKSAFALVDSAMKSTKTKGKSNAKEVAAIFSAISKSFASEQAKNMQTISEYVSDLSGVLKDAFDNRYGEQEARDSITSAFISIKEAADSAAEAVKDATNELSGLKADKGILEYQLGIAKKYGDTLRANAIQAKLDSLNADIAKQEKKKADAIADSNKSLTDNSSAAIKNRATIRDLVSSGNDYLLALAKTGASSQTLKDEAAKLATEFMEQGTQLGFAKDELETYVKYFKSDFTTVVDGVPKNISIKATADPALNAVKEFVKDANDELKKIKTVDLSSHIRTGAQKPESNGGGGGADTNPPATTTTGPYVYTGSNGTAGQPGAWSTSYVQKRKPTAEQVANYHANKERLARLLQNKGLFGAKEEIAGLRGAISIFNSIFGTGYSTGGLIAGPGTSTSDSIPARLSNGEYVVQASAVKHYGTDFMNSLNRMQMQQPVSYANAGTAQAGSSVVYLSPEDRQLLRAAADRPITLYADNRQIAQSANAGNQVLAQRGLR